MAKKSPSPRKGPSDFQVIGFIVMLCLVCGFLLATAAYLLQAKQTEAKEFDQQKQLLIAAKILNHNDELLLGGKRGKKATPDEIKKIAELRIRPLLTDSEGKIYTLEEKGINLPEYLAENKKTGVSELPLKLFYAILPEGSDSKSLNINEIEIVVIPVSGFGLWAPIYGFIALSKDGNTVIGTTWYEHGETPGLGANITEPWWQNQFFQKVIFQESPDGKTDFLTAPIGIIVVKGKVRDVFGTSPKSKSAVDGMSGATLTGDGVTQAYRASLTPYRNFFIHLQEKKNE